MVFREYFRFQLVPLIWMSRRLERSPTIYRLWRLFHSFALIRSSPSLSLCLCFSLFFTLDLRRRSHFLFFRFVLFRRLFSIEVRLHAHSRSAKTSWLRVSRMEEENVASFLGKEISGPDHAIDFHAPTVRISLCLPNHPIVCRVCQDSRQSRYFVHRLGMFQF